MFDKTHTDYFSSSKQIVAGTVENQSRFVIPYQFH